MKVASIMVSSVVVETLIWDVNPSISGGSPQIVQEL